MDLDARAVALRLLALSAAGLCSTGCGLGTAAVGAAASGGGGSGDVNAAPVLSGLAVYGAKTSPAVVELVVADPESDSVGVALRFRPPGASSASPMTLVAGQLTDLDGNTRSATTSFGDVSTSPAGTRYFALWDFAQDGLGPGLVDGVTAIARITSDGGSPNDPFEPDPLLVDVGNDAPVIDPLVVGIGPGADLAPEVSGIVRVPLRIFDTAADEVLVRIEYRIVGVPGCGSVLARDAEIGDPLTPTPDPQVDTTATLIGAQPDEDEAFFWDTAFEMPVPAACSLAGLDREIELVITAFEELPHPDDVPLVSTPLLVSGLRIDNNEAPVATLAGDVVALGEDERLGLAVPVAVVDAEADEVTLVLQWALEGEPFPPLTDLSPDDLRLALDDPVARAALQLASETPSAFGGRTVGVGAADRLRLPELATGAGQLFASQGIVGRRLQILRPALVLSTPSAQWNASPLVAPVAALPLPDGLRAWILDESSLGQWSLFQIDLTDGTTPSDAPPSISGVGTPTAGALSQDGRTALVATGGPTSWSVARVDLVAGAVDGIVSGASVADGVRGTAVVAGRRGVASVDDALLLLDFDAPAQRVLARLGVPWGVVSDPLSAEHVYAVDRSAQRIVRVDVRDGRLRVVPTAAGSLPDPDALAIDPHGRRLSVTTAGAGGRDLVEVPLGEPAALSVRTLVAGIAPPPASVAAGPDRLVLLPQRAAGALAAVGGIAEQRRIAAFDPASLEVTLDAPFDAPPGGRAWRVRDEARRLVGGPFAVQDVFVWDSTDVAAGGVVRLRILPFDDEVGIGFAMSLGRTLPAEIATPPASWDGGGSAAVADVNGDGLVDLVGAGLAVSLQRLDHTFPAVADFALGGDALAAAADVDGDGDVDLFSHVGGTLTLFEQNGGAFDPVSFVTLPGASELLVVDVDLDGDLDLVSTSPSQLAVYAGSPAGFDESGGAIAPAHQRTFPDTNGSGATPRALELDGVSGLEIVVGVGDPFSFFLGFPDSLLVFSTTGGGDPLDLQLTSQIPLALGDGLGLASIDAADRDGDGDEDLFVAYTGLDSKFNPGQLDLVRILPQEAGTFSTANDERIDLPSFTQITSAGLKVLATDVTGDGKVDVVAGGSVGVFGSAALTLVAQRADGTFGAAVPLSGVEASALAAADLDADGRTDVLTGDEIRWAARPATFAAPETLLDDFPPDDFAIGADRLRIHAGDVTGDGLLDLLVSDRRGTDRSEQPVSTTRLLTQSVPGTFAAAATAIDTAAPGCVVARVDGDERADLVLVGAEGGLRLRRGLAGGGLGPPLVLDATIGCDFVEEGPQGCDLAVADVDADGRPDVLVATTDAVLLYVQPTGGFAAGATPDARIGDGSLSGTLTFAVADLDQDGRLDVVSGTSRLFFQPPTDDVLVFLQPPGGFVTGAPPDVRLPGGPFLRAIQTGDVDGDGRVDLVTAISVFSGTPRVDVFLQPPSGFTDGQAPDDVLVTGSAFNQGKGLVLVDFDEDGRLDVATPGGSGASAVHVFLQESPGRFPALPTHVLATPFEPDSLLGVDLDADGTLDLVAGCAILSDAAVVVFWGSH